MFTRVRTSLLLWNLLIIGAILLVAGSVTYFSQRQSLYGNVDRLLAQEALSLPRPFLTSEQPQPWSERQTPFTLVVDASGHVLADPDAIGVKDVALPKVESFTFVGRFSRQLSPTGGVFTIRRILPGQTASYVPRSRRPFGPRPHSRRLTAPGAAGIPQTYA